MRLPFGTVRGQPFQSATVQLQYPGMFPSFQHTFLPPHGYAAWCRSLSYSSSQTILDKQASTLKAKLVLSWTKDAQISAITML